jgi:hypothetical protein
LNSYLSLTVPSRSSSADKLLRAPFRARSRSGESREAAAERRAAAAATREGTPERETELRVARLSDRARQAPAQPPATPPEASATPTPELESELGGALYNCSCGYVFEAPVLTSVDCPNCGDSQAW